MWGYKASETVSITCQVVGISHSIQLLGWRDTGLCASLLPSMAEPPAFLYKDSFKTCTLILQWQLCWGCHGTQEGPYSKEHGFCFGKAGPEPAQHTARLQCASIDSSSCAQRPCEAVPSKHRTSKSAEPQPLSCPDRYRELFKTQKTCYKVISSTTESQICYKVRWK